MTDGLKRLIEPWTLTVTIDEKARIPYAGVSIREFPPLIDMLYRHVTPDTGKTLGGANDPSARSVLDIKSLDMIMHIQDITGAWLQEWRKARTGDLKADLRAFWDQLNALYRTGAIDEMTYEPLAALPDAWAVKVWDLIEPPLRLPLRGSACPRCQRSKITTTGDEEADNLLIIWRDTSQPTVECQWSDCAAIWIGEAGLIELGRALDIEINMEAIDAARHAVNNEV